MKRILIAAVIVATMALAGGASAAIYTEGFEGPASSYNLTSNATIVTDPVHRGNQSLQLSLVSSSDYARVRLDTSSLNMTLGQIMSADYWVQKTIPKAEQAPYLLFSLEIPGQPDDSTLAVMYNNPGVNAVGWQDVSINTTQLFHVEGDTQGLANPSSITLADLSASTFSSGVTWGSFLVNYVRIGYGAGGDDGIAQTAYVDDLTINYSNGSATVPEPATMIVWSLLGGIGLAFGYWRRNRAA